MKLLATVRYINDALRSKGLGPVLNRGQVSRGIQESAVLFLNQERSFRQFAILVVEDTDSAFARTGQILVAQVLHDIGEHRIVEALSQPMVEADIQAGINALEGLGARPA